MLTLGTRLCRGVHVLPRCSTTQHVIHLLQLRVLPAAHLARDVAHVGTRGAGEAVASRAFLSHQHVPAGRAEQQHFRFWVTLQPRLFPPPGHGKLRPRSGPGSWRVARAG